MEQQQNNYQPECKDVGGDVLNAPSTDSIPSEPKPWYVDLTREEFIACAAALWEGKETEQND